MASYYLDSQFISSSSSHTPPEWQLRNVSPAPTAMTRQGTPAPTVTPKKPFMSRLFSRKTSKPALKRTSTIQTIVDARDSMSRAPSRMETPTPFKQRSASPFPARAGDQYTDDSHPPLPRMPSAWTPSAAPPQQEDQSGRQGAQTAMSNRTTATVTKKPKTKRSFSAITNLFKAGPGPSENLEALGLNTANRRARRGTLKNTFSTQKHVKVSSRSSSFGTLHVPHAELSDAHYLSRQRASTVISLPPQSPSLAMLFDASQAEAGNTFDDSVHASPITYTPFRHQQHGSGSSSATQDNSHAGLPRQTKSGLTKSRSTPDLSIQIKKGSIQPSPTFPPSPFARSLTRTTGARASPVTSRHSMALDARSPPLTLGIPLSPLLPKSPTSIKLSSGLSIISSSQHKVLPTSPAQERSFSPAPSAYSMSTVSKRANKTFLDQILDVDLGGSMMPSDLDPWSFNIDDDGKNDENILAEAPIPQVISGLSVKMAKELRPDTAGTFGRPYTGNRPMTANRPTTGISRPDTAISDRPDTSTSTFLGTHTAKYVRKPMALRLDGRMRRISNASANSEALEEGSQEDGGSTSTGPPSSSQLSFNLENLDASALSRASVKEDSGFDDHFASKHLDSSLLGEKNRPLSTSAMPAMVHHEIATGKADFRPTTADTTHLPFDLPDLDIAFDPKASLGSLGRQSSVSTLSDFGVTQPQASFASQLLPVGSNRGQRLSMPNAVTVFVDQDATPKKHVSAIAPAWGKDLLAEIYSTGSVGAANSTSSSVASGQMERKAFENMQSLSKRAQKALNLKEIGIQTEPPTPAIVMTFADAEVPLYSPHSGRSSGASRLSSELAAAETARINDPHDPFGDSYFPPVHTLLPGSPFPSSPSSATTANSVRVCNTETEIVNRLLEQLEKETVRREALEYSLASLRESAGADLRRLNQKMKDLVEENKALLFKLASLQHKVPADQ